MLITGQTLFQKSERGYKIGIFLKATNLIRQKTAKLCTLKGGQDKRFMNTLLIFSPTQIKDFTIHPTLLEKKLLINLRTYL